MRIIVRERLYGIDNRKEGNITLIGGTITVESSYSSGTIGIDNQSTGSICLGIKDGNINQEIPVIEAINGIENRKGKLYWYDGIIRYTTQMLYGTINDIEENAKIIQNTNQGYLGWIEPIEYIQNMTTGKTYTDLQVAIDETSKQDTLQFLQNYQQNEAVMIEENQQITLDFNGKTISTYGAIYNQGELTIVDNKGNGSLNSVTEKCLICNTGNMVLERWNTEL